MRMGQSRRRRFELLFAVLVLAVGFLFPSTAWPRVWKPSKAVAALDYAQIVDNRGNGEIVIVWWLVPQMFDDPQARDFASKYVVFGLLHANVSSEGSVSFADVDHADVKRAGGTSLTPLPDNQMPPLLTGTLATIEASLRQALGPTGQSLHFFAFDGAGLDSCAKGGLSVLFAGENYTFETPVPGCP